MPTIMVPIIVMLKLIWTNIKQIWGISTKSWLTLGLSVLGSQLTIPRRNATLLQYRWESTCYIKYYFPLWQIGSSAEETLDIPQLRNVCSPSLGYYFIILHNTHIPLGTGILPLTQVFLSWNKMAVAEVRSRTWPTKPSPTFLFPRLPFPPPFM
jgi:hypothetical protein